MIHRRSLLHCLVVFPLASLLAPAVAGADDEAGEADEAPDHRHPLLVAVRDELADRLNAAERRALDAVALERTAGGDARAMLRAAANTAAHQLAVDALRAAGLAGMTDALRNAPLAQDDDSARAVADAAEAVADDVARALDEAGACEGDDCEPAAARDEQAGAAAGVAMAASQLAADAADPTGYEDAGEWGASAEAVANAFARAVEAGVPRPRAVRAAVRMLRQMALTARRPAR